MTVLGGIDRRLLQNVDWPLLGAMGGLVILSATTLASLHIGRAGGNVAFRQLAWFTLGLFALVAVASVDYRRLVRLAPVFFVMGLVGLASVFVLGRTVSGARRWILLGPMSVQPSEVFKLCFVLMVVWFLSTRWAQPVGKTVLVAAAPLALVPAVLIVRVAWPLASSATVDVRAPPSRLNVTCEPGGRAPAPGSGVTVAVNTTSWPNTDGFTLELSVVVVVAWLMVCVSGALVLVAKFVSPP